MGKRNYFFWLNYITIPFVLVAGIFFLLPNNTQAAVGDENVVINEVMANPQGSDTNHEWLEITNFGLSNIDLKDWQLKIYNDPASITPTKTIKFASTILPAAGFFVLVNNSAT